MKTIHLLRHAKSSWANESIADIERPLNKRGIKACQDMAPHIHGALVDFTHTFCSPAIRAQSTIKLISQHLPTSIIEWQTIEALYCFDSRYLQTWCCSLNNSISEIFIIAHNPALTDFCKQLSNSKIENIPTCGYAKLISKTESNWQNITANSCKLIQFIKPKEIRKIS